jgi:hypothetical protein
MEAARRVFGDEARLIQVIHPQTPLEALGERVGLWKAFHILSPLFGATGDPAARRQPEAPDRAEHVGA